MILNVYPPIEVFTQEKIMISLFSHGSFHERNNIMTKYILFRTQLQEESINIIQLLTDKGLLKQFLPIHYNPKTTEKDIFEFLKENIEECKDMLDLNEVFACIPKYTEVSIKYYDTEIFK